MKLNKNGMTLIELAITVSLMSVVLLFLYSMLFNFNKKDQTRDFSAENHNHKLEILNEIQKDLMYSTLDNIAITKSSDSVNVRWNYINSYYSNLKITKVEDEYKIEFRSRDDLKTNWTYKSVDINLDDIYICQNPIEGNLWYVKLIIQVYTDNEKNKEGSNNLLDDLVVSYMGNFNTYIRKYPECVYLPS